MNKQRPVTRNVPRPGLYRLTGTALATPLFSFLGGFSMSGEANLPNRSQAFVLAPNHRSQLDILALGLGVMKATDREVHFMSKKENLEARFIGRFLAACGAFPVDRGGSGFKMKGPLSHASKVLEAGGIVSMFPEATRKSGRRIEREDLFDGIAWLSVRKDVAIVPVGIAGTDSGEMGPIHVTFGETVSTEELKAAAPYITDRRERLAVIMDEVHMGMQTALDDAHIQRSAVAKLLCENMPLITGV